MRLDTSVIKRFKHLETINSNGRLTNSQITEYLELKALIRAYGRLSPKKQANVAVAKS